jgi:GTP-binding protein EngB required for normal cell division
MTGLFMTSPSPAKIVFVGDTNVGKTTINTLQRVLLPTTPSTGASKVSIIVSDETKVI